MSNVEEQVKKIVVEHLGIEESKVTPESKFIDDLGADSLDTVELVMAFEEKFGIEIPDDAAETILTVKNAIDFIDFRRLSNLTAKCMFSSTTTYQSNIHMRKYIIYVMG